MKLWKSERSSARAKPPRRFVAVDFDSQSLRLVSVQRNGRGPKCKGFHVEAMGDASPDDPQAVGEVLARAMHACKLGKLPVVMTIPRDKAVLKPLRLPPGTPASDIAGMVQFQVGADLPFAPEQGVLEFTVAGEVSGAGDEPAGVEVLAAAVKRPVVELYQNIAATAGVKLLQLGLRPSANVRALLAGGAVSPDETISLLDLHADETEIDVVTGATLGLSRSVARRGASQGEEDLALIAEVVRTLQGYRAHQSGGGIARVLLCGDKERVERLRPILAAKLALPCEAYLPGEAMGLRDTGDTSTHLAVIGMACLVDRSYSGVKAPIDFLHPKRPAIRRDPKARRNALIAAAVALVVLTGVAGGWWNLDQNAQTVDRLRAKKKKAQKRKKIVEVMKKRAKVLGEWREDRVPWLSQWACLASVLPDAQKLYIDDLNTGKGFLKFVAHARDSKTLSETIAALGKAGYATQGNNDDSDESNLYGYTRQMEITVFLVPGETPDLTQLTFPARPVDDDLTKKLGPKANGPNARKKGSKSGGGKTKPKAGNSRPGRSRTTRSSRRGGRS